MPRRQRATQSGEEAAGKGAPRRPRGRPPRLSRDGVIDALLAMLEREPDEALTIARIAREVEAVPAALYRHFESLDDILDSVLARVLETSDTRLDEGAAWEEQLAGWMRGLRSHLLRYPTVISWIGRSDRTSPAWYDASSALVEILERAGLSGRELAVTYLWILETTVGLVMQEAAVPLSDQVEHARRAGRTSSEATRRRFAHIAREIEGLDAEDFFTFAVEQATAVAALRPRSSGA